MTGTVDEPRIKHARAPHPPLSRLDRRAAFATGLAALAVYVYTLAPTVTGEDSGEFIGAAFTLGVPHPPGYPVWTMLAHLFTWIPLENPAWRVNLFSAVCGAATVSLLVLIGITLTRRRTPAVLAALLFAFSRVFWEQALIAEVYTLNTLFLAAILLIALRGVRAGNPGACSALALLAGVSTGVHNTMLLLLPFWAIFTWLHLPAPLRRDAAFHAKNGGLFLLGLVVWLYLPLASRLDPAVDWGDPETLARWWDVVRREQFAFMVEQYPRSLGRFAAQLSTMGRFWVKDYLTIGAFLGAAGAVALWRRDRFLAAFLTLMALSTVVAITWMQNFEQNREWLWVMRVFMLPAEFITAIGIACALAWGGGRRIRSFLTGLAMAGILGALLIHSAQSKRAYFYAEDYGRAVLAGLPENAIFVAGPDHQAFPTLYLQAVEGERPDVTLLRKYGYLDLHAVPELAGAIQDAWLPYPKLRYEPEILGWLLNHTSRPLVLARETAIADASVRFHPLGLFVQALRPGEEPAQAPGPDDIAWRTPLPDKPVDEYSLSLFQYDIAVARARHAFAEGQYAEALDHVADAANFGHREPAILNNLGTLCARYNAWDAAAGYFEEILAAHPEHDAARRNLERVTRRRSATPP